MSEYVGQAAQSLGNVAPGLIGGGPGGWMGNLGQYLAPGTAGLFNPGGAFGGAIPTPPTDTAYSAGGLASSGDPNAGAGASYAGGGMAAPAPTPASVLAPTGPVGVTATGAPFSPAAAPAPGPASPSWWQSTFGGGGGTTGTPGTTTGTATDPKGMGLGGWINMGGNMFELINRYLLQRQLQNPQALADAANTMAKRMNARVRAQLVAPTTAAMEESSGVNAPMIYGQAITNALAPGLWEAQQNALREEIQALIASGQAYPQMAANLVPPSTYGGTQ